ncbi:hypothetical protein ACFVFQ_19175 [Streptomyces sp. NPDC057743]|uniref:hypothetical protein n=1 Tax=Streptomyces sp. NPDC057743 TaxID=3346236 RepID=UPI003680F976
MPFKEVREERRNVDVTHGPPLVLDGFQIVHGPQPAAVAPAPDVLGYLLLYPQSWAGEEPAVVRFATDEQGLVAVQPDALTPTRPQKTCREDVYAVRRPEALSQA